ncbi:MAG TPA: hypothetical protein VMV01_12720 [Planctomycetota bacterium]|jgi:hypothetical protein|nr:hypothetical protein [Planctomycetota bacterium]HZJ72434.1 hypothetical protein [Planctomycetota bacterium]
MAHLIVGWLAVAIGAVILFGTIFNRHSSKESMTSLPIAVIALVIGLWQLGVLPLGEFLSGITGIGKR